MLCYFYLYYCPRIAVFTTHLPRVSRSQVPASLMVVSATLSPLPSVAFSHFLFAFESIDFLRSTVLHFSSLYPVTQPILTTSSKPTSFSALPFFFDPAVLFTKLYSQTYVINFIVFSVGQVNTELPARVSRQHLQFRSCICRALWSVSCECRQLSIGYARVHAHTHAHAHAHAHTHTRTHTHTTRTQRPAPHAHTHARTHPPPPTHTHTHTHTRTRTRARAHAHTHTHTIASSNHPG